MTSLTIDTHLSTQISDEEFDRLDIAKVRTLVERYDLSEHLDINRYVPPGPVARAFIRDLQGSSFIMGPVGSGKTTASAFKRITAAAYAPVAMHPHDNKPTRMCRGIVLRDSFRSAEKTVLESWKSWFPKGYPGSAWTGGNDRPVTHILRFWGKDGVRIEAITEFAGLGENSIETLMKGREYSFGWLNEFDTHADGALADMETRVGRYPHKDSLLSVAELEHLSKEKGKLIVSGQRKSLVIGDLNAPTLDNHAYRDLVTNIHNTPDRRFYRQPSGRSPDAENRFKLLPDYYDRMVRNLEEGLVRRLVDNEFGYSRSGKPVYEAFQRSRHVATREIGFNPELELLVGIDISTNTLNPACVFVQILAPGRVAVIGELSPGHGFGSARFAELLKQAYEDKYAGVRKTRQWADPASEFGGDSEGGQLSAVDIISTVTGLPVLIPAGGSNELGLRLDAVKTELRGYHESNSHLIICPKNAPLTLEAFEGKYRFKRRPEKASNDYEDAPDKGHPHSDLMDALQYVILGVRGRTGVMRGAAGRDREPSNGPKSGWSKKPRSGFDVHKVGKQ